jgi:Flp pilus assembly protein TadG
MIQRILHLCNSDNGGAAVEFAIVFPALLLMLAGIIQFSFAMWQSHATLQAVSHSGRYAMLKQLAACDAACVQGKVEALMPTATVSLPTVSCTSSTNWMTVTASHNVGILVLPGVSLGSWSFSYRVPVGPC